MKLSVRGVSVSYDGVPALRSASFECGPAEVVGVVGPNGAGKSTLLKAVLGLVPVDAGRVEVDGRPGPSVRRDIAYLPQRSAVDWAYPAVVEEVVAMGRYPHLRPLRRARPADRSHVDDALARLGLSALRTKPIGELSGGQQQRVLLARALAQEARLLLLDEPFAGVDAPTEDLLRERLRDLRAGGATVVVVNHDLTTVTELYDRLLLLARDVIAYGPLDEVFTADLVARAFGAAPALAQRRGAPGP